MIESAKFVRKVTDMMPLERIILEDVLPVTNTSTDAEWLAHIEKTAARPWHPCCTSLLLRG